MRAASALRAPTTKRARLAVGALTVVALAAGATAVHALTTNGSQQISQAAPGVRGATEVGDYFAAALAVGDFDRDGHGDIIAGTPFEDFGSRADVGMVNVLYGTPSGIGTDDDKTLHQASRNVPGKAESNDLFGSAVAVGDFDGDGYADAVVGVAGEDSGSRTDAGGFTVLYGSRTGLRGKGSRTYTAATSGVRGPAEAYAGLGSAVAVGDFNRDGYDDIAVGAPGAGRGDAAGSGAVHVLYGSDSGITKVGDQRLHQAAPGVAGAREVDDGFGAALAAGDFDGDGDDDLAVGIPGESSEGAAAAGAVEVFRGSRNGLRLSSATVITQGSGDLDGASEMDDMFGAALAAGDFDGDGRDDLAVGSPGEAAGDRAAAGKVHVLYGSSDGLSVTGSASFTQATPGVRGAPEAGDELGLSLVAADFNDNGRVDLAIGVPGEGIGGTNGAGMVHVLFGSRRGLRGDLHQRFWPGNDGVPGRPRANGGFSRALAAGDVNGDGRADLVGGAPGQMVSNDASAGALILIFG